MIQLKNFQTEAVEKLTYFLDPKLNIDRLILKAPTGSGKTIILLSWINGYIESTNDDVAFVWFTPGAGELEEQSKNKSTNFSSMMSQDVDDVLASGFTKGSTTFINYERVVGKKAKAFTNGEKANLQDRIDDAIENGIHFIVIVDEAHLKVSTDASQSVISRFNADKEIWVSATIDKPNQEGVDYYEIPETAVIDSGLITKAVIVNENIENIEPEIYSEFSSLFCAAESKRVEMVRHYENLNIEGINPLVLVQLPDDSNDEFRKRVENYIESNLGKTYDNETLAIWLSNIKRNAVNVTNLNDSVQYLIIKQAIATGWDAPRASIIVKLRENMAENFTIQTIGRIRRMPQPDIGHYNDEVLDNSYIYTFDQDFLNQVYNSQSATQKTPILKLKASAGNISLTSERRSERHADAKIVRELLYAGLKDQYGFNGNVDTNMRILKKHFGDTVGSVFVGNDLLQGRYSVSDEAVDLLRSSTRRVRVDYNENRMDVIHALHELDRVLHLPVGQVQGLLQLFFMSRKVNKNDSRFFITKMNSNQWTAFILNYWCKLRDDIRTISLSVSVQNSFMPDLSDFTIPTEERYNYNPAYEKITGRQVLITNAYEEYTDSIVYTRPSNVERLFERYMETLASDGDFVYKNGDKGPQYFSILYNTISYQNQFFPDYLVQMKNGDLWIIETKGGQSNAGQNLNIDDSAENKYYALRAYVENYGQSIGVNLKWAFVRDMDNKLYYRNDELWFEQIVSNGKYNWDPISELFGKN